MSLLRWQFLRCRILDTPIDEVLKEEKDMPLAYLRNRRFRTCNNPSV
jgi:hypothetical protein